MAAQTIFEALTTEIERALADLDPTLPPVDRPAQLQTDIAALRTAATGIENAADIDAWFTAVGTWQQRFENLAATATGQALGELDALIGRVLAARFPRLAAFLALAGVLTIDGTSGTQEIDWDRLHDLLTDPETLINEDLWDAVVGDLSLPLSGRSIAVLAALLVLAPRTIAALASGSLRVAPLLPPATRAPGAWRNFRNASAGWVSITVPFGDPTKAAPYPDDRVDLKSGIKPDLSGTLAFRSERRTVNNRRATDFEVWLALAVDQNEWSVDLGDKWILRVSPGVAFGFGHDAEGDWHGAFRAFSTASVIDALGPADPVTATFTRELPGGAPDVLLGPPYDTRLEIRDLNAFLKVREAHPIFEIGLTLEDFAIVIAPRWWRTFGDNTGPSNSLRFDLDLTVAFVEGEGIRLNGATRLQWVLNWAPGDNKHFTLHSIEVAFPLAIEQGELAWRVEIRFYVSLVLGPVTIALDGAGAWVGNSEPSALHLSHFLVPTGVGLQISAGPITGGGFVDYKGGPTDRYAGVLYLKAASFEIIAFGIHERTPTGRTSFVMVLGVRFSPGWQLGYGFAITGIGGLVGINRRADSDALRERLVSGAAGNVLFAEDPIKNAPAILGDLDAIFPAADGVFVVGPTLQITWLKVVDVHFVKFDVGVFIELPGPTKIILLGVARARIPGVPPNEKSLLSLRLDIVGVLDFTKRILEFDATLINSHLLEIFQFTGDAALRLSWGERPYVMLTIGGFHPDFRPEPVVFPQLERVALTYGSKEHDNLWLRFEAYLAVTTNTFQVGGAVEVGVKAGPINAIGFIRLDALIQFTPFYFSIAISAGFAVRWRAITLAGVKVTGKITGPGPIVITASLKIQLLFISIGWSDTFTLGSASAAPPALTGRMTEALRSELKNQENLEAIEGQDNTVIQKGNVSSGSFALVSPVGRLAWRQKRAPLGVTLERFEGSPLATPQAVLLDTAGQGAVDEWFSPGSFMSLSKSEALNRSSFDRLQAGAVFGFASVSSGTVTYTTQVVTFRIPEETPAPALSAPAIPAIVFDTISGRSARAEAADATAKVGVTDEGWSVRSEEDGTVLASGLRESDAHQRARYGKATALADVDVVDLGAV